MIRFLPFILIPILIVTGLGYWRFGVVKQSPVKSSDTTQQVQDSAPVEVPKTLPEVAPSEAANSLNPSNTPDPRVAVLETAVTDLKARIAVLEKATPVPTSASTSVSKSPLYIPMGASGDHWLYADWTSLNEYQVSINPDDYAGYSGMQLEVNFRLVGTPGTGYVRLYNMTNSGAVSSEISTTSTSFGVLTSNTFKLTSGQKLYTIQVKSTNSQDLYIQSARIKVNF